MLRHCLSVTNSAQNRDLKQNEISIFIFIDINILPFPDHAIFDQTPLAHPFSNMLNPTQMNDTDPHIVETVIIPQIINQAQGCLRDNTMSSQQFSELMKQVMILKEQAMIKQADRRHDLPPMPPMQRSQDMPPPPRGHLGPWGPMRHSVPPMMMPPRYCRWSRIYVENCIQQIQNLLNLCLSRIFDIVRQHQKQRKIEALYSVN